MLGIAVFIYLAVSYILFVTEAFAGEKDAFEIMGGILLWPLFLLGFILKSISVGFMEFLKYMGIYGR